MEQTNDLLTTLEDLMVREFRGFQQLLSLTKEERSALSEADTDNLIVLVEEKESVLDELGKINDARRMTTDQLAQSTGLPPEEARISGILPKIENAIAERLRRLQEGTLTIAQEIRALTSGNLALASTGMDQTGALQGFLVGLAQSNQDYRPNIRPEGEGPVVLEIDQQA
ncbi:MAG: flagellar protein FlgN [Chloroflexi bacterium]|nr:MAG: flagellar protein FlgN [Chloroflexota bacterium]MBL1194827.1 flagellar protein FlgN [Chloroflexota bacterium]NOH12118.1 flagellar protein FlgN [Chloroflexota bacterium]